MTYMMSKSPPPNFIKIFHMEVGVAKNWCILAFLAIEIFDGRLTHF